jgi:hypothetical protein
MIITRSSSRLVILNNRPICVYGTGVFLPRVIYENVDIVCTEIYRTHEIF